MPVQIPGPRLFRSIPFRFIGAELRGGGGQKGVNVSLNVVPFVDMMTILVCFLLMVFAADGSLSVAGGLQLPDAVNKDHLRKAPIIIVTRDAITFQGEPMANVKALMDDASMEWKIIELYDRLQQEQRRFLNEGYDKLSETEKGHCVDQKANPNKPRKPEDICLEGLLIMQADKDTPAKVLNRVLKTAYAAQYPNIMFAVNLRSSRR